MNRRLLLDVSTGTNHRWTVVRTRWGSWLAVPPHRPYPPTAAALYGSFADAITHATKEARR